MATNIFSRSPFSATGARPGQWFLVSSEDYDTLITPGYVNSVSSAGVEFQQHDIVYATYNDGQDFAMFIVTIEDGVATLQVYSPNDNSFIFTKVVYVAKGGSDLNPGTSLGLPKLTVQAAINSLEATPLQSGVVVVLDSGQYTENLTLPFSVSLHAPNASFLAISGDLITIADAGVSVAPKVVANSLSASAGNVINNAGPMASLTVRAGLIDGNISLDGELDLHVEGLSGSTITLSATGILNIDAVDSSGVTISADPAATVVGHIRDELLTNNLYGNQVVLDKLTFQKDPVDEVAGRTLAASDSNTRIVYNNASDGNFELPQTSDVAIPLGTLVEFLQLGLGKATFIAGTGVTIVSISGAAVRTAGSGAVARAWKYTDTIWVVDGVIEVTP